MIRRLPHPISPLLADDNHQIEVYALDTELNVGATDDPLETRDAVMAAMAGHVLGKSVYMGTFNRPQ